MPQDTAFTSWRVLHDQLLNDLASKSYRTMQSYTLQAGGAGGSRTVSYRSLAELLKLLEVVKAEMAIEEGTSYAGRTYASNGGRG